LYGGLFAAPIEFDARMTIGKFEVQAAELEPGIWSFWLKGANDCPSLRGTLKDQKMYLEWLSWDSRTLRWFEKTLISGALGLSLERLGATKVQLPATQVCFENLRLEANNTVSSFAYSHWLKLRVARVANKTLKFAQGLQSWSDLERRQKSKLDAKKPVTKKTMFSVRKRLWRVKVGT
jgi:hypothetical protein